MAISMYMRIRREYLDQSIPEFRHPWNVSCWMSTVIAFGILIASVFTYTIYPWGNLGFGEFLLAFQFLYYLLIIPTGGIFGYFMITEEVGWDVMGILSIIGTYSLFLIVHYHYRFARKQKEFLIHQFISRFPQGNEIPIHDIALVFLLNPVTTKSLITKMIRKGKLSCTIQNWRVKVLGYEGSESSLLTQTNVRHAEAMMFKGLQGRIWSKLRLSLQNSHLSGEAEFCIRCGNPLKGEPHCPICGYRNLYSYFDSMHPQLSPLTTWVSSRHGGIDPLRNALFALIAAMVGTTFLVAGLAYTASSITGIHDYGTGEEFLMGLFGGAAITPFLFIPIYLKVRKEILEQRSLTSKDFTQMIMNTNILVTIMVLFSTLAGLILDGHSAGAGEIIFGSVLTFYASIATGGISTLFFMSYWVSERTQLVPFGIIQLFATYALYSGIFNATMKREKKHTKFNGISKKAQNKAMILNFLSSFQEGDVIPLHAIGRVIRMEPNRVKPLLSGLIRDGHVFGWISESILTLEEEPRVE